MLQVHGLVGRVVEIVYAPGTKPIGAAGEGREVDQPLVVFVKAEGYLGPSWEQLDLTELDRLRFNVDGVFPVQAVKREFTMGKSKCVRVMLPLTLGWATSIHKSQGMSLEEFLVDVGPVELALVRARVSRTGARVCMCMCMSMWLCVHLAQLP